MGHARVLSAFEGHPAGRILVATLGDDPAAGAEISVTVPGRATWEILTIRFLLDTNAVAGNRLVTLEFTDGNQVFFSIPPFQTAIANTIWTFQYSQDIEGNSEGTVGVSAQQIPRLVLPPGFVIQTTTPALDSGDNFAAPVLLVREIPERGEAVWDELARAVATEIIERRAINV